MKKIKLICTKICKFFNLHNNDDNDNQENKEKLLDNFLRNGSGKIEMEFRYSSGYNLENFKIIKKIGKGGFGKVYLVQNNINMNYYAMKKLNKKFIKEQHQITHTKTEREILQKITHPFIVKLAYAYQTDEDLFILTDFMPGGELFYHLRRETKFSEERTKFYLSEILLALIHLHKNHIIYRDLKPENILLDKDGHVKLTDFGLSKILRNGRISLSLCNKKEIKKLSKAFTICGTPEYLAPEILLAKGYDKSVDWWSFGVIMYEMLVGFSPYKENKVKLDIKNYYKKLIRYSNISDIAFDLIQKLLKIEPKNRLGYSIEDGEEIKKHIFFKGINWDDVYNKKLEPKFKPKIYNDNIISNFDRMFTDEKPSNSFKYQKIRKQTCDAKDRNYADKIIQKNRLKLFNTYQNFNFTPKDNTN